MKLKIKWPANGKNKLLTVLVLLFFIGAGCQKEKINYADESMVVNSFPGLDVYKTKGDYINYVAFQITPNGELNAIPSYILSDPRVSVEDNGYVKQNFRWRLKSGYIVDKNSSIRNVYTNITIDEYVDYNTKNGVAGWPNNLLEPRIIDKDPFLEYYHLGCDRCPEKEFTLKEINDMITNGTIEELFTKIK